MNWLCIIPARGGSKGIPGKNLVQVAGRPLIAFTLDVACAVSRDLPSFEVFVSTDSPEIRDVVEQAGVPVPFLRPAEISGDRARSIDSVRHTLEWYHNQGKNFDAVLLLQPTSPLRSRESVLAAISTFEEASPVADSLITVCPYRGVPLEILYRKDGEGLGLPVLSNHGDGGRRQENEGFFVRNGAIYASSVSLIYRENRLIGLSPLLFEMREEDSLNLDTPADLEELRKRFPDE